MIIFVDLGEFVLDWKELTPAVSVFHRDGGHWAGYFLDLGAFFRWTCTWFLGLAQGGGNLDIATRWMQEVVDAGEIRILKQHKQKKRWRGHWG